MQWFVPRWTGSLLTREIGRYDHGPKPQVAVSAVPFWDLFGGHFQDIYINAHDLELSSALTVQHAQLNWQNGTVSLGSLEKGKLKVTNPGHATMSIELTAAELSTFLAHEGTIAHPTVSISPSGVALSGRLLLGGSYVPLDTKGSLSVSSSRQQLIFHPTSIDGLNLPVLTDIQLLNLATMKALPMSLKIEHVQLENQRLVLTVGN
nr:DUF2993 domain-containing protein [Sulfobacillus harzensis]